MLFLDNTLLALSRKTSRRNARRRASWNNSTASTTDTSTLTLLPHHPYSRNASRSPSRSAPLSRVSSTTNMLSRTQTHISTTSPPLPNEHRAEHRNEHRRGRSDVSELRHNVVDFAYHTSSQEHPSPEVQQIGLAVSPPLPERNPSRGLEKNAQDKRQQRRYESVGWSDEQGSDAEDLRRLGRARTS